VTSLLAVNGPALTNTGGSSTRSIAIADGGGSLSTAQSIASQITSTGPLGDLTLQSTRGLTASVSAVSIVGGIFANGPSFAEPNSPGADGHLKRSLELSLSDGSGQPWKRDWQVREFPIYVGSTVPGLRIIY
jgi:hypothetical protein